MVLSTLFLTDYGSFFFRLTDYGFIRLSPSDYGSIEKFIDRLWFFSRPSRPIMVPLAAAPKAREK